MSLSFDSWAFDSWDGLLVAVVALQATVLAYMRSPRWKAFLMSLPFPFTVITLSLDRPIGPSHVLALLATFAYIQAVRLAHLRLRLPILAAIGLAVGLYAGLGWVGVGAAPSGEKPFWLACALTFGFGLLAYLKMPYRSEPGHRTPLPLWQKLPVVFSVVFLLVQIKGALQGFATLFPLLGVVGAYEARHSLWTIARQVPVLILCMVPMMAVTHLAQERLGLPLALALGWLALLGIFIPFTRRQWARQRAEVEAEPL